MKGSAYILGMLLLLLSCKSKETRQPEAAPLPVVSDGGKTITIPDTATLAFFGTEQVNDGGVSSRFTAIGKIGATVMTSNTGATQHMVLFEDPNLAGSYTQLIQHQINIRQIRDINIRQKHIELDRTKDLNAHGAATGQELLSAQTSLSMEETNLANEKAALIEHEARLKSGGFDPVQLCHAPAGTAYIICDIPENQIGNIREGAACNIFFSSFPNESYTGKIEDVADVVDNTTRMVKIRIRVNNSTNKLKAGMFANVSFGLGEGNMMTVGSTSLVTVQGKNYVFVRRPGNRFERREVQTGPQIGDRMVVFSGVDSGDQVAREGVMQLKGLSFGY